jgi:hypothetical protein
MRTSIRAFVVVSLGVLLLSSCSTSKPTPTPTPTPSKTASPTPTAIAPRSVLFYFVGDTPSGFRLFSETHQVTGKDLLDTSMGLLLAGKVQPLDSNYSNIWGHGTTLISVKVSAGTVFVDFHLGKLNVGSEAESRAIDQLLWTAAGIDTSVTGIQLLVDGAKVESLAGHVDTRSVIKMGKSYDVLSALQISSINEGQVVANPVVISGMACTFEANVAWVLFKDSTSVKSGSTTAAIACPDRSAWKVDLGTLTAGSYRFVVKDFSAKDGSLVAQDDKNFVVKNS